MYSKTVGCVRKQHPLTVLASQRERVLSAEQEQMVLEKGKKLTALTESA